VDWQCLEIALLHWCFEWNPLNLYIFWKLNSYRIQSYLWNFLKSQCRSDIKRNTQKYCFSKFVCFCTWTIGVARLTSEMFSHTSPSKRVSAIFQIWSVFFCNLLKFDIINVDIPFYKSKASLRLQLFCMMKYMHQYRQKRWKYFGFVPKLNFFLLSLI